MNLTSIITRYLRDGKFPWSRLFQAKAISSLKYILSFKKFYSEATPADHTSSQQVVLMIDGRTIHGGMSDRLRGILASWYYCKTTGKNFKINWTFPYRLTDYLIPNLDVTDWRISDNEICYNPKYSDFKFINGYTNFDNDECNMAKFLKSEKPQIHLYCSNTIIQADKYPQLFKDLFIPTPEVQKAVKFNYDQMGNVPYVSVTYRFQSLLGDFPEGKFPTLASTQERENLIQKCLSALHSIRQKHPNHTILVTSDSSTFLNRVKNEPFVYIAPGEVVHMDFSTNRDFNIHLKSFVDLFMLTNSQHIYTYTTDSMFANTGFAYTASLIGGKPYTHIHD